MLVDSDDKIVVAGQAGLNFGVARYTTAGALDTTFSTDGMHTVDVAGTDSARAATFVGSDDSKILLGGFATNNNATPAVTTDDHTDFALVQLSAAGALDTGFSTDGKHTVNLSATARPDDGINSLTVQSDNKIVAAGYSGTSGKVVALARFTAAGALDTTFGSGSGTLSGYRATSSAAGEYTSAFVTADNKILAVGSSSTSATMARYSSTGQPDNTFGTAATSNRVATPARAGFALGAALRRGGEGIVTAGYVVNTNREFAAAAFNLDGTADAGFGVDGVSAVSFGSGSVEINATYALPDGKTLAAGTITTGTGATAASSVVLMRFNADGALDGSLRRQHVAGQGSDPDRRLVASQRRAVQRRPQRLLRRRKLQGDAHQRLRLPGDELHHRRRSHFGLRHRRGAAVRRRHRQRRRRPRPGH